MPRGPWTEEQRAKHAATIAVRKAKEVMHSDGGTHSADTRPVSATQASTVAAKKAIADYGDQEAIQGAREAAKVLHCTTVEVTYCPFDGDPHTTVWNGIKFRANVPVELDRNNPAHFVEQLHPKQFPGQNGEALTKHVPHKVFMGDMARTNPSFDVDGQRQKRLVNSRVVPPPGAEWTDAHEGQISESNQIDHAA